MDGPKGDLFCILVSISILLIVVVVKMLNRIEDLVMELNTTRYENVKLKRLLDNNGIEWRSEDGKEIKR